MFFGVLRVSAHGNEEANFEPPVDVVLVWAKRAGLTIMIISVLLTLFVLIVRRRRLMEGFSKLLLFLGLCVLPVPVMFLGAGVGMEESKAVHFCSSCHGPMGPFISDMMDPESENLAAVHFKNRYIQREHCWTCHSDYGIAGTAEAKFRGLTHITYAALDRWEPPIELSSPYNWRICLDCHAESALFQAPRNYAEAHEGVLEEVLAGETTCVDCHVLAHPEPEERRSK
ncbi:MAG: NapC/NirT family cytochrome c [Thermoanaerobaculia bacterium]|nr:NapC/NirT family cytochrome c [Thermoanaerobaculia bacterium]